MIYKYVNRIFLPKIKLITLARMACAIFDHRLRVRVLCCEMAGELFRNMSEKLSGEGACPRLWCRASNGCPK